VQKILKWFAPLIAAGVTVFIVFFIISINSHKEPLELEPLKLEKNSVEVQTQKSWLHHFSQSEKLGYFYPVNEVYVKVDLDEKIANQTTYKLSASLLDPYQLFCLKEELSNHSLKYYLKQDAKVVELLIYSKDINKLNSLVKILKNYQIAATIKPYKEDV